MCAILSLQVNTAFFVLENQIPHGVHKRHPLSSKYLLMVLEDKLDNTVELGNR